jgi:hypothetical protein
MDLAFQSIRKISCHRDYRPQEAVEKVAKTAPAKRDSKAAALSAEAKTE